MGHGGRVGGATVAGSLIANPAIRSALENGSDAAFCISGRVDCFDRVN
jgi:hypothetical protein